MIMPFVFLQRRPITLLELLISMTLMAAILSSLSYFYLHVTQMNREMDRAQMESFEKRYVEYRLSKIFPQTFPPGKNNEDFHFFTRAESQDLFQPESQNLLFSFDNKAQLNKEMSHHVVGRLYLDKRGNFTLATWPSEKRWKENEDPPIKREILMENVETLEFSFFAPPNKGKTFQEELKPDEKKILPMLPAEVRDKREWENEWKQEYRQLPAIVKITLTRESSKEKQRLIFAFALPNTLNPIIYDNS